MGRNSEEQEKFGECVAYYSLSYEKLKECVKLAKVSGWLNDSLLDVLFHIVFCITFRQDLINVVGLIRTVFGLKSNV